MKFKLGDRVAVYSYSKDFEYFGNTRQTGKVVVINMDANFLKVEIDGTASQDTEGHNVCVKVHPKQCRRLMKKARRRRVWVNTVNAAKCAAGLILEARDYNPNSSSYIEFIEVRKKNE